MTIVCAVVSPCGAAHPLWGLSSRSQKADQLSLYS